MCEQFRKCAKCGARSTENPSLSFHRFPIIGKERPEILLRSRIWAEFVYPKSNYNDVKFLKLLYTSHKMLCSRHFAANSFISGNRLNKFSVPIGMEHILQKAVNDVSSPNQFSVPTISSHETESFKLLSRDVSDDNSTVKQIPESGKINLDDKKFEELSRKEKLLKICRRGLQKIYDLKQKRQQQNNLNQIQKLVNNDDFSVPTNLSPQPEGLELDIPEERSRLKQAPETGKHVSNFHNHKVRELSADEKLFNIYRQRFQKICVLKHKWQHQKNFNQIQNLVNNEDVRKFFKYKMTDNLVLLLQSQIKYYTKKPKRRHYNLEQQILASTLYKKSPARYRLLRRFFSLPCQCMLKKLIKKVPLDAGINRQIFIGLADMVQMNRTNENICTLMFNEMNIKRSQGIKIKSLVFMLSGVMKKWKQPIAYYMLANYTTADILVFLIKEVLEECFNVGLIVVATVCKISPVYIKALEILGATKENPYFYYEQYEIVTILDPPHLLKCFRDLFMKHDISYYKDAHCRDQRSLGTAKWSHIQTFYERDKMNSNFVFAPALTDTHIYPNKKQKTRIKLAAQIFSHSVSVGIMAKISSRELPAKAVATANLLYKMDELFDALNADSKDLRRGKKYSSHLTNKSPHLEYLKKMKIFISEMRFLGLDTNTSCQEGWIRTINAVQKLWYNLYQLGVRSLSTRRLNQDVLENCFACIRYYCGLNYNPTVAQFVAGIKTAVITDLKYCDRHTNCEDDTLVIANNLQAFLVSDDTENTSNVLELCQYNT